MWWDTVASCLAFAYFFSYESAGFVWALVRHLMMFNDAPCPPLPSHGASIMMQ
eukprot:COSAG01_NODE_494_length_16322_cov_35.380879_16_plen_53_part_00